jgi:hypothetical protein
VGPVSQAGQNTINDIQPEFFIPSTNVSGDDKCNRDEQDDIIDKDIVETMTQ